MTLFTDAVRKKTHL